MRVGGKPPNPDYNVGVASGIKNLQLGDYPVHYDLPAPSLTFEVTLYRRASCNGAASVGEYEKDGSGVGRRR